MKNKSLLPYKAATVLIPILIITIFLNKNSLFLLSAKLPPCPFYEKLHLYCPACGNTRCVKALFRGDVIAALKYNICPVVLSIFLLLGYLEMALYSFGKHVLLLPRKLRYYIIVITLLILYVGLRNFIPGMIP